MEMNSLHGCIALFYYILPWVAVHDGFGMSTSSEVLRTGYNIVLDYSGTQLIERGMN